MTGKTIKYVVMGTTLLALSFVHSAAEAPSQPAQSLEDYRILWERNIFSHDRGARRRQEEEARAQPKREHRPEQDIVLRGVSQQGDRWVAFFENLQSGITTRVEKGEDVARGRVTDITLDKIEYELNGQAVPVAVGQTLDGGTPEAPVDYGAFQEFISSEPTIPEGETGTGPSSGTAAEEGGEPTEDEAAILEQLMRQREEELQ